MLHNNERIVKHKIGLLNLAEELSNVSKACKIMGLSRDTFYGYKAAVENGGLEDIIPIFLLIPLEDNVPPLFDGVSLNIVSSRFASPRVTASIGLSTTRLTSLA